MAIVYKSGKRHTDADCLSHAPLEDVNAEDDDYAAFVGVVNTSIIAQQQRDHPELQPLIDFLEGRTSAMPKLFAKGVASFCLRNEVHYKVNFSPSGNTFSLVVPTPLRKEVLEACHDDPTSGYLGHTRTLCRVRQKYY